MRTVGSASWRFAHDIDERLHGALYLRDALRLPVDDGARTVPRLIGDIPDRSAGMGADTALQTAGWWSAWWQDVVDQLAPTPLESSTDLRSRLRDLAARHRRVIDPPEWRSMADMPTLRDAASALWGDACRWFGPAREPYLPPRRMDVFEWNQVRDCATMAAREHRVSPAAVSGSVEVLLVEGRWWRLVAPGIALCSIAAACDGRTARDVLTSVFDSHLAG